MQQALDPSVYFAAAPAEQLGASIAARLEEVSRGRTWDKEAKAQAHLYGRAFGRGDGSVVGRKGEDNQLLDVNIKKAKALLKSLVGLVLGPPKSWRCSARNADVESRGSVLLGANLMEFFWKEDGFDTFCDEWVEAGYAFDESYVWARWSPTQGQAIGVNPVGQLVLAGGLRATQHQKWDVFKDCDYKSFEELPWLCLRSFESKWDLAATAKAASAEELKRLQDNIINSSSTEFLKDTLLSFTEDRRDVVPVYHFFHRPTASMPQGLYVQMLDGQTVLRIEECEEIPVRRFAPGVRIDSSDGDSQWTTTLGIEDLTDMVESALASNLNAFATQAVEMPGEMKISTSKLNNLAVFERDKLTPPGQSVYPMQLVRQPDGADKWLSQKASDMAFVTGQNDVQLGQPDTAQMNAKAFAILKSAATERNSLGQRRALRAIGELGALVLRILSRNITTEEAIAIGGRAARLSYPSRKWTGSDLEPITHCFIEVGNPLEQHPAGRLEILQALKDAGVAMTAEDVQQVIETGRLEQAIQPAREESLLISFENDELLEGKTPVVHVVHNHLNHVLKHACLASQPAVLQSPQAVAALDKHIDWHYLEYWPTDEMWPAGAPPKADPRYRDRLRLMLGQQAPSAIGPPLDMNSPAGGAPSPSGPPSNSSGGSPPALSPPEEGAQQLPSVIPPEAEA